MSGSAGGRRADTQRPPTFGQAGFLRLACLRKPVFMELPAASGARPPWDTQISRTRRLRRPRGLLPGVAGAWGTRSLYCKGTRAAPAGAVTSTSRHCLSIRPAPASPPAPSRPRPFIRPHPASPLQPSRPRPPIRPRPPTGARPRVHQRWHPGAAARCSHGRRRHGQPNRSCHSGVAREQTGCSLQHVPLGKQASTGCLHLFRSGSHCGHLGGPWAHSLCSYTFQTGQKEGSMFSKWSLVFVLF